MKQVDHTQVAFKRQANPLGLLNPGKMLGWDDPHCGASGRQSYLYKSRDTVS